MPDTASIPDSVRDSFQDSLDHDLIHLYDYASTSKVPLARSPASGSQFIHVVPGLASKPAVPLHTPDLTKLTKRDPFEGPEYGPGEKVLELESSDGSPYALVHNMYALMREHFMAIPHFGSVRPFRPQTSRLAASDLEIASTVVQSYAAQGRDLICFFNGGPLAGASQPHLHMQFCPFQHAVPPLMQSVATAAALADGVVSRLDLPWVVYCVKLAADGRASPGELHRQYLALVTTSEAYLASLPEASVPPAGAYRDSHNVFLTASHLFLTPRRSRLVAIPRVASIDQGRRSLGGGWEDVAGAEREMRLSVNGLSVIGYWYVGSREEEADLRAHGVERTLRECGYVNDDYRETD
ncbi:hypothetical protein JCM11491_001225 [Sporobolomyces phaffii]